MSETRGKKWGPAEVPKRVLFIRIQALGDTIITYPYIRGFAEANPSVEIHFLTRADACEIPENFSFIKRVWTISRSYNSKVRFLSALFLLPRLLLLRYNVVYDLQNNRESRVIRKGLLPKAWCAFDRFSPLPAGDRVQRSLDIVGIGNSNPSFSRTKLPTTKHQLANEDFLKVVVNPAGFYPSRNWPFEYYLAWAKLILKEYSGKVLFIFLGIDRIADFANKFCDIIPENTLNLVNKTSLLEVFGLIQKVDFVLTEDSGLMHMAWTSGVPTLAIFGSTRSDWSRPLGEHTKLLDSSDLSCGNCMLPECKFGDNRCLTRYSPEVVFNETLRLLN